MNRNPEHFDEQDDADLAALIGVLRDAPPLRAEFAAALATHLDAEFASAPTNADLLPLTRVNGHAHSRDDAETASTPVVAAPSRRRWRIAWAAALLLIIGLLASNPPALANVVRAIVARIEQFATGRPAVEAVIPDETVALEVSGADAPTAIETFVVAPAPAGSVAVELPKPPTPASDAPIIASMDVEWPPLDEALAPGELSRQIDELLTQHWQQQRIHAAEPATDAEFMRRAYLDLTGRVPSVAEAREFLADQSPVRREQLIDQLLSQRDHATHWAAVWRTMLLPDDVDLTRLGGYAGFDEWLAERFAANEPYDEIVRQLLLAEGRVASSGPLLFYAATRLNPEELAARTSRAFLGVRMECAQCHDHPFDDNVSQHNFWSFAAFFARISRPVGKMEMTSPVLQVKDSTYGDVTIPESDEVVPPRLPSETANAADAEGAPPRRQQLAEWITSPRNGQFARATVNRVWAHLFGRGLVEPVDDMRPANPSLCPDVLELVSRDFAASGFDMQRLLRELVLTRAYQLSSGSADDDPSRGLYFAQMNIKAFTADQLYDCISVATGRAAATTEPNAALGLARATDVDRQAFIERFRTPPAQATDYQAGIPQALTLMHGGLIHNATDTATGDLLKSLTAPFFTDEQRLDALFLATLSRYPQGDEQTAPLGALGAAANDAERQQILGDVLWALMNCAEFTLNH